MAISYRQGRNGDRDAPERFPQGGAALDITEGKLFSEGKGRDRVPTKREVRFKAYAV
jgi:hypothetical protein